MTERGRRLTLAIDGGPATDPEEVAEVTGQLRRRLLELDVDSVEPVRRDDVPPGAKPGEAVTIGALVVTAAPIVLRSVVRLVDSWLRNRPVRAVTLTVDGDSLELTNASRTAEQQLTQAFIDRHARG